MIGNSWGVGGSVKTKNLKKCMKLNSNFQRGGVGGLRKNLFCGGGMDIFWNYNNHKTTYILLAPMLVHMKFLCYSVMLPVNTTLMFTNNLLNIFPLANITMKSI